MRWYEMAWAYEGRLFSLQARTFQRICPLPPWFAPLCPRGPPALPLPPIQPPNLARPSLPAQIDTPASSLIDILFAPYITKIGRKQDKTHRVVSQ